MTLQLEQPDGDEEGTSATEAPSTPAQDLEAVMDRLQETLDKRFSGFQSSMDRKIAGLSTQFAQAQSSLLTPEERDEQAQSAEKKELEQLRMERQLYQLRDSHPEAVDLIIGSMAAQTLEEQIDFIESKFGKKVVAQVEAAVEEAAEETEGAQEVQVNNPGKKPKLGAASAAFADVNSEEAADAILNQFGRGALQKLRDLGR